MMLGYIARPMLARSASWFAQNQLTWSSSTCLTTVETTHSSCLEVEQAQARSQQQSSPRPAPSTPLPPTFAAGPTSASAPASAPAVGSSAATVLVIDSACPQRWCWPRRLLACCPGAWGASVVTMVAPSSSASAVPSSTSTPSRRSCASRRASAWPASGIIGAETGPACSDAAAGDAEAGDAAGDGDSGGEGSGEADGDGDGDGDDDARTVIDFNFVFEAGAGDDALARILLRDVMVPAWALGPARDSGSARALGSASSIPAAAGASRPAPAPPSASAGPAISSPNAASSVGCGLQASITGDPAPRES